MTTSVDAPPATERHTDEHTRCRVCHRVIITAEAVERGTGWRCHQHEQHAQDDRP